MKLERTDDIVRIALTDADEVGGLDADKILAQLVPSDAAIRLDLSAVPLLRSAELAALVEVHKGLLKRGKDFAITGLNEGNRKLLRLTRLDQLFQVL
jgi:anti-anti-sigma regulatory factor